MPTHIAEVDLVRPSLTEAVEPVAFLAPGSERLEADHPLGIARGIASAVLISIPFWALLAFTLYVLV